MVTGIVIAALVVAVILMCLVESARISTQNRQDYAQWEDEQREAFDAADLSTLNVPISLKSGERCHWEERASKVIRVTHSRRVGTYGGPSVRVARGLYLRAGAGTSHTVSSTAFEPTDVGTLYLTNVRAVFVGTAGSEVYAYDKMVTREAYADGVSFDMPNKDRVVFITGSPRTGWALERILSAVAANSAPPIAHG